MSTRPSKKKKGTPKSKHNDGTSVERKESALLTFRPQGNPIPLFTDIVMRYCDVVNLDTTAFPTTAVHLFAASGLYDPDITGTGHQPLGYDQWMGTSASTGFYNHYLVVSSEIKLTFYSQDNGQMGQLACFVGLSDDTVAPLTYQQVAENPSYKMGYLGNQQGGHDILVMKHRYNAARQFGMTRASLYADTSLQGAYNSNPSENCYFAVIISGLNGAVNPTVVCVAVEIVFRAHLTERKEIPGS